MPATPEAPPHRIPIEALGADALPPARISVELYHRMIQSGVLASGDPLELLDGILVRKMTKNPPHTLVCTRIRDRFLPVHGSDWLVRQEAPVTLSRSEPEPDVSVVRGPDTTFMDRNPAGPDCVLVVEVADSSIRRDIVKADLYAEAGVPEYWIIDIDNRELIVHRGPTPDGYRDVSTAAEASVRVGGQDVRVDLDEVLAGL